MFFEWIILILTVILVVAVGFKINKPCKAPPKPFLVDEWWYSELEKEADGSRLFKTSFLKKVLEDIKYKLKNTRIFVGTPEFLQKQYGIYTNLFSAIVDYWKSKYNWKGRDAFLNQFPQFNMKIVGMNIYYTHVKPTTTEDLQVIPLLLIHGWPGSVEEFYDLISQLTKPQPGKDFIYEVIAPSLPGFEPEFCAVKLALIFKNLMYRLGIQKYYVQGEDWGDVISSYMVTLFRGEAKRAQVNSGVVRNIHPLTKIRLIRNFFPTIFGSQTN